MAGVAGVAAAAPAAAGSGKARGVPMAAITVEVFSDFQCPSCRTLHEQTLKPLIADFVDRGKVYLRHRDFPLPGHPYSRQTAALAAAAARLGRYDEVADTLFARQAEWSPAGTYEQALGAVLKAADLAKIRQLAQTGEIKAEVEADFQEATRLKLNQTPTMIIQHKGKTYPIAGMVNYNILRRLIEQLLSQ